MSMRLVISAMETGSVRVRVWADVELYDVPAAVEDVT